VYHFATPNLPSLSILTFLCYCPFNFFLSQVLCTAVVANNFSKNREIPIFGTAFAVNEQYKEMLLWCVAKGKATLTKLFRLIRKKQRKENLS